ncbi:hypothetical protein MVEN_01299000 [Mycena venus]|uniref:DUF6818 domain-containing protein n=1 Tax=Mycena venus TaxID=2733690 RepID=A0A8H7CWK6_9AGAR|nr:hypothetical protein MVEN_01299000 [Mycena venus]
MSDPTAPPFTQSTPKPNIFYDGHGTAWHCDANGQWVPVPPEAVPMPLQPPFEHRGPATVMKQGPSQPAAYSFPPPALSSAQAIPPHLIDPRLRPLPQSDDHDLTDSYTIAKAILHPAVKVGGVRQKDKGKKHQLPSDFCDSSDDAGRATKRGRPQGSSNYNKKNTKVFLKIAQKLLPTGPKGWKLVTTDFKKWAVKNNRPEGDVKSIETKYKQLLRKKKPTGDAHCPPNVKRAHRIERLINQKADTRELSDLEFDGIADAADTGGAGDSSDDDVVEVSPLSLTRLPPASRRPRTNAPELVNQLSKAFDPKVEKVREDQRADRSFQTTHMFTLSQEVRDAQTANDKLCKQLTVMQDRIHDAEHGYWALWSPDLVHEGGKVRCERVFPEGGGCTLWVSDPFSDDDAEKENKNSSSSSHSRRSSSHDNIQRDDCFSLSHDDTLIDYSSIASASGSSAVVTGPSSSASGVEGTLNGGVGSI